MPYSVLIIVQKQQSYANITQKIDWDDALFELTATEYHSSLGLQRFISAKPQVVLLEPRAVFMDIDKYVSLMEEHSGRFIVILCNMDNKLEYDYFNKHIVDSVDLLETSAGEFMQRLKKGLDKLQEEDSSPAYEREERLEFFREARTAEETNTFLKHLLDPAIWHGLWVVHCRAGAPVSNIAEIEKTLGVFYRKDKLLFFPVSDNEFILLLNTTEFPTEDAVRKQAIGLIKYNLGTANKLSCAIAHAKAASLLPAAFHKSGSLIKYAYFEPGTPFLSDESIARMRESMDGGRVLEMIIDIGISVIRQKHESLDEYIEMLYFALIKSSFDFSLLGYVREKLGLLYDFLLFQINPEAEPPAISMEFQSISAEAEAVQKQFFELLHLIPDHVREMKPVMLDALTYAYMNYADPNLLLSDVAAAVDRSPSYLSSLFSATIKISFVEFLTRVRVRQAKRLIAEDKKVKEVAEAVGIPDQRYFSNIFKKHVGITPTDYRKSVSE